MTFVAGSPVEEGEAKDIIQGEKPSPEGNEVGGRAPYWGSFICCNCYAVNEACLDTDFWKYIQCWNCGYVNRA